MLALEKRQEGRSAAASERRPRWIPAISTGLLLAGLASASAAAEPPAPAAPDQLAEQETSDDALERASRYFDQGRYHSAVKQYAQAILGRPKDPKLYAARGDAYVQCQEFRRAVRDYNQALKYGIADKAWLYTARGNAKAYLGDYPNALTDYQKAIDTNGSYSFAYAQRALVLEETGRLEDALADCTRSITLSEKRSERKSLPLAHTQRASVYRKLGKLQNAIADCQTAMKLSPRFPPAFKCLGDAVFDMGQFHTAIGCYNCAIDLKRDYARAYYRRGLAYQNVGEPARGRRDIELARQIDPDVAKDLLWKR